LKKISYINAGEKLIWETKVYFRITASSMRNVYTTYAARKCWFEEKKTILGKKHFYEKVSSKRKHEDKSEIEEKG
jgi:hypothetical protein